MKFQIGQKVLYAGKVWEIYGRGHMVGHNTYNLHRPDKPKSSKAVIIEEWLKAV